MSDWNLAEVWETVAEERPAAEALVWGPRRWTWAELDRRADGVAGALLAAGLGRQAKVAQYLLNGPEYLESLFGAAKAGMVPVNTNYRYAEDELAYLWDNADVEAVVFDVGFAERAAAVRPRVPGVRLWLAVGAGPVPPWAVAYEDAVAAAPPGRARGPWGRSGDDLLLIYTGGTTGLPKGVMWRQDDLFGVLNRSAAVRYPDDGGLDGVRERLRRPDRHPSPRQVPGPPLMHGTGLFTAIAALDSAGCVVLPPSRRFHPEELLDLVEAERVTEVSIVGDAFARPLLAALDAHPGRWDLSSLWLMVSSGVMWSAEVKAGLLRHAPRLTMVDTLGSSEAVGIASSRSDGERGTVATAGFQLGPHTRVVDDDGRDVAPGSGRPGLLALRGRGPVGYYKDPEKTARTWRVLDGERWTVPGDVAEVAADGTVRLLGRGSAVINTGGEKVFPEEVEEVLKRHPAVGDAVVVGVPDARFGESVVAVVEAGRDPVPDEAVLVGWVKAHLAGYKAPRRVLVVESVGRAPNGKVDHPRWRREASSRLGSA